MGRENVSLGPGGEEHVFRSVRIPPNIFHSVQNPSQRTVGTVSFSGAKRCTVSVGTWVRSGKVATLSATMDVMSGAPLARDGPVVAKMVLVAEPNQVSPAMSSRYKASTAAAEKKKDDVRSQLLARVEAPVGGKRKRGRGKAKDSDGSGKKKARLLDQRPGSTPKDRGRIGPGGAANGGVGRKRRVREEVIHALAIRPMSEKTLRSYLGLGPSDLKYAVMQALEEVAEPHPRISSVNQLKPDFYHQVNVQSHPYTSDERARVVKQIGARNSPSKPTKPTTTTTTTTSARPSKATKSTIPSVSSSSSSHTVSGVQPSLPSRRERVERVPAASLPSASTHPVPLDPLAQENALAVDSVLDSASEPLPSIEGGGAPADMIAELGRKLGVEIPPFPSPETIQLMGKLPPKEKIVAGREEYAPIESRPEYRRYKTLFNEKLYPLYAHLDADLSANTRLFEHLATLIEAHPEAADLIRLLHAHRLSTKDRLQAYYQRLDAELREIKHRIQTYVDSLP